MAGGLRSMDTTSPRRDHDTRWYGVPIPRAAHDWQRIRGANGYRKVFIRGDWYEEEPGEEIVGFRDIQAVTHDA